MKREELLDRLKTKTYLGDSVYAHHDGYHIILETINGDIDSASNRIALEPPVLNALDKYREYINNIGKQYQEGIEE